MTHCWLKTRECETVNCVSCDVFAEFYFDFAWSISCSTSFTYRSGCTVATTFASFVSWRILNNFTGSSWDCKLAFEAIGLADLGSGDDGSGNVCLHIGIHGGRNDFLHKSLLFGRKFGVAGSRRPFGGRGLWSSVGRSEKVEASFYLHSQILDRPSTTAEQTIYWRRRGTGLEIHWFHLARPAFIAKQNCPSIFYFWLIFKWSKVKISEKLAKWAVVTVVFAESKQSLTSYFDISWKSTKYQQDRRYYSQFQIENKGDFEGWF